MGDPAEIDSDHNWKDQRSTYDALRARCAVAREDDRWVALRHAEVVAAATDAAAFSSNVSARRAIPNSLDGTQHATYRAVVDRYRSEERRVWNERSLSCRSRWSQDPSSTWSRRPAD
jgi:hypothetical protein